MSSYWVNELYTLMFLAYTGVHSRTWNALQYQDAAKRNMSFIHNG